MLFIKSLFSAVLASAALFYSADACSCRPLSEIPITPDCPQRFLSVVTITDVEHESFTNHFKYEVIADYTPRLAEKKPLSAFQFISSTDSSAACGVTLVKGQTYLLFGGLGDNTPHLVSCGSIVQRLEQVPNETEARELMDKIYTTRCVQH